MNQINIGNQIEEGNNGCAHQPLIDSFELPNNIQEQFLSVPTYVINKLITNTMYM